MIYKTHHWLILSNGHIERNVWHLICKFCLFTYRFRLSQFVNKRCINKIEANLISKRRWWSLRFLSMCVCDCNCPSASSLHCAICYWWCIREKQHAKRHKFYVVDMSRCLISIHPSVFISLSKTPMSLCTTVSFVCIFGDVVHIFHFFLVSPCVLSRYICRYIVHMHEWANRVKTWENGTIAHDTIKHIGSSSNSTTTSNNICFERLKLANIELMANLFEFGRYFLHPIVLYFELF